MHNRPLPLAPAAAHRRRRLPPWLKVPAPGNPRYLELKRLVGEQGLTTVCQEARCPNIGECWGHYGTATFMILGEVCSRNCGFCAVTSGRPPVVDEDEPRRVGEAVSALGLTHAVITSVTRDDLPDGGAGAFAETIRQVRARSSHTSVEVLIPDFGGDRGALATVLDAQPDILNHNVETVPRMYPRIRPQADYARSLGVLAGSKQSGATTKTGIMVGLGETVEEIVSVMRDLARISIDIVTIGQYLQPTPQHASVRRFYRPDEFAELERVARETGIGVVESGPLVRSSYHAAAQAGMLGAR